MRIDRRAAEDVLLEFELGAYGAKHLDGGSGDLGADPVTGQQNDSRGHGGEPRYPI